MVLDQRGKLLLYDGSARPPKDVPNKKYAQDCLEEITSEHITREMLIDGVKDRSSSPTAQEDYWLQSGRICWQFAGQLALKGTDA